MNLTTEINEYVAVLWDKTRYPVSKKFYEAWKNPEVLENAIMTISEETSIRKSAISKIDKLRYEYIGRWGKKYSGSYHDLYAQVPVVEHNALKRQIAEKNAEFFAVL